MYKIQVDHAADQVFMCLGTEDVLNAARRQGVPIPLGCRGGGCGMCKIRVMEGMFSIGTSSMEALSEEERKENYSLACKTYPLGDMKIKIGREEES